MANISTVKVQYRSREEKYISLPVHWRKGRSLNQLREVIAGLLSRYHRLQSEDRTIPHHSRRVTFDWKAGHLQTLLPGLELRVNVMDQ